MASSWGGSWGVFWGDSWGAIDQGLTAPIDTTQTINIGGRSVVIDSNGKVTYPNSIDKRSIPVQFDRVSLPVLQSVDSVISTQNKQLDATVYDHAIMLEMTPIAMSIDKVNNVVMMPSGTDREKTPSIPARYMTSLAGLVIE